MREMQKKYCTNVRPMPTLPSSVGKATHPQLKPCSNNGRQTCFRYYTTCLLPRTCYKLTKQRYHRTSGNDAFLPHAGRRGATHALQSAGKLGVLLLDFELCAGCLGVGEGVDDLALGAGELGGALEVLQGVGDLALLQEELGHGGDGNVALGVDCDNLLVIATSGLTDD